MQLGQKFDSRIARLSEGLARRISRRDALRTAIVGGASGIAALTLGQRPALAQTCYCGPTYRCNDYGHDCHNYGCPTGYELCKNASDYYCSCAQGHFNRQGYCCEYTAGTWVACGGLGKGYGYELCYDCIATGKGDAGHGNTKDRCTDWCTCLSACICCTCTSPDQVRSELSRVQLSAQSN
jgi:hypothetical protein